jgi:aspartate kinase
MRIFKFGGASVKNAEAVENVGRIITKFAANQKLVVVVSAMGKMTNALEQVLDAYRAGKDFHENVAEVKAFHQVILEQLFPNNGIEARKQVADLFTVLQEELEKPKGAYGYDYDRIVSFGELLSTRIIHHWLKEYGGHISFWHDTRNLVITNNHHRRATVNWEVTKERIVSEIESEGVHMVQGFIGSDGQGNTTTLGREGSDYTASVFAHCLDAEDVTIWKDVPGVLNGDPRVFDNTVQLESISYREAIELAYYGASVIHPKTIQPVQHKNIPLYVRSFVDLDLEPTVIGRGRSLSPKVPCYIRKTNQALITVASPDLAFIVENHLSKIYEVFHRHGVTVNMMQNSAISTSFCVNQDLQILPKAIKELSNVFDVRFNKDLKLFTIRHHSPGVINALQGERDVLLEQVTRETYQMVLGAED